MKIRIAFFIGTLFLIPSSNANADLSRKQRVADAETMLALFEHRYAPIEWKQEYLGVSFDKLASELLAAVDRDNVSDVEFYTAMSMMRAALHDTHSWFLIPSNYVSRLGFSADYVDGRVLIDTINRKQLPNDQFPFARGDELISIDGQPAEEIMQELAKITTEANDLMTLRQTARHLTRRGQETYPVVPTGDAVVEIFSRKENTKKRVTLTWQTSGSPLATYNTEISAPLARSIGVTSEADKNIKDDKSALPILEKLRWSAVNLELFDGSGIGDEEPFFPMWDSFVERTMSPLFSGIFFSNGKRIGFIRIPTWSPDDPQSWIYLFEKEIPFLERKTDALVIDQTNNGGGSICLGEVISSFFATKPIASNLFQYRANRHMLSFIEESVSECQNGEYLPKEDCEIIFATEDKIRSAIEGGRFLTDPVPMCNPRGIVYPYTNRDGAEIVYTKPVLMLVNEFSISTADMTPAFLQDSGRVVIFGGRTCGAGGSVETIKKIGHSDFGISQTESLTVRPKAVKTPQGTETHYLENIGVTPDVEYPITANEFVGGYKGYRKAIENTLEMMLK